MTLAVKVALNPNTTNQPFALLFMTQSDGALQNFYKKEKYFVCFFFAIHAWMSF